MYSYEYYAGETAEASPSLLPRDEAHCSTGTRRSLFALRRRAHPTVWRINHFTLIDTRSVVGVPIGTPDESPFGASKHRRRIGRPGANGRLAGERHQERKLRYRVVPEFCWCGTGSVHWCMGTGTLDDSIDSQDLEVSLLEHHRSYSGSPAAMQGAHANRGPGRPGASPTPSLRAESVANELEERLAAAAARFGPAVARASARKKWAAAAPLTSATANRANEVDIGAALRGGGDLGQAFRHSSPAASSMDAVASPPQRSPDRSLEWRPAFRDGDGEISNVLGLARPSLGGYTPRLEQPHRPFASPVASHRSIQTSLRFDGPDLTQSLAESKSAIIQNCSSARASLQQLSDDVKNFDAAVQKRIQQLRLEATQAKEHEESLKG